MTDQIKTIPQFLAEAPDVDVSATFERCWGILSTLKDRITEVFPVERHPSCEPFSDWRGHDGTFGGSLNTFTGPGVDWLVHSWAGNPTASILDMNLQVWLGPEIDVPHLAIVFGTIPTMFHYSDYLARRDLATDVDYVRRYYDDANGAWLGLRGDSRFTWSVSHGAYMRAVLSPVGHSYTAERNDETLDALEGYVTERVERWLGWVADAKPVPDAERDALRDRDRQLRRNCYTLDPMNDLARKFLGDELVETLVPARYGADQMAGA